MTTSDPRPVTIAPDETSAQASASTGGCGGACGCGGGAAAEPELDVRDVPHSIRHGVVFGALDALAPGEALVLVAPHDPLPLLGQLDERRPGVFAVTYLQQGPEAWRLRLQHAS